MIELLKIIHYLSFAVAIGAGVSNQIVGLRLKGLPPEAMPNIGAIRLALGKVTTHGLILLWITGLAMVFLTSGAAIQQNPAFIWKMAAVLVLTAVSIMANVAVTRARANKVPPDPQLMRKLGLSGLALATVTLILAVLAFN